MIASLGSALESIWFAILVAVPTLFGIFIAISIATTIAAVLMHAIVNDEPVDRSWENISCQTLELVGIFFTCVSQLMHFSFPAPKFRPHSRCKTPIILVPGYHMNRWSLLPLQYYLYRCGFENIWAINNPMLKDDIFIFVDELHTKVEQYYEQCGQQQIMLIGHSMGGLISRHYMEKYGTEKIRGQISFGTPYRGTKTYRLAKGKQGKQFKPGSDICNITTAPKVPHLIIWSTRDWVVVPSPNGHLDNSNEMVITDAGHLGMLVSVPVFKRVHSLLNKLEHHDSATSLEPSEEQVDEGQQAHG